MPNAGLLRSVMPLSLLVERIRVDTHHMEILSGKEEIPDPCISYTLKRLVKLNP